MSLRPPETVQKSIEGFQTLAFPPPTSADAWVYASIGAWQVPTRETARYEFVIQSPVEDPIHIETLAMVSHFHADPRYGVFPGKILAIGRPWMESSCCTHLLVSLPYPFGPQFEYCSTGTVTVRFLWLVPITKEEADFAKLRGVDALEELFEQNAIDTLDVNRASVV